MTNYANDIMDLLQGETPKQKYEYLQTLLKPKEKKFEAGAKAVIIHNRFTEHGFDAGENISILKAHEEDEGVWLCVNNKNEGWWISEREMELFKK